MQRPSIAVRPATMVDGPVTAKILACAFIDDPVMCYIFADVAQRPNKLMQFFDLVRSTEDDPADTLVAGSDAAVTVWRKPGKWRTPRTSMLRHAWPMLTTFGTALPRALRVQSLLDRHHPAAPHWYLEFAGCLPERQGQGFAGAAIRARLHDTDLAGVPTALETANPANLPIYGGLGYVVTGTFSVTPDLQFWSMWRPAA